MKPFFYFGGICPQKLQKFTISLDKSLLIATKSHILAKFFI